jgi:hypothetical protein
MGKRRKGKGKRKRILGSGGPGGIPAQPSVGARAGAGELAQHGPWARDGAVVTGPRARDSGRGDGVSG